ncbi:ABC transporter ATP-binding protein [Rubrimonas cliftonensis]|uniref:Nucleoside ABC transporter ATP-binding protein n=1 Tax=Rubrimonas cliftonensis TaxID=89524 RepID=A0A1H3YDG1_9RHOB|nr:ABC transporter ATP-binding protein [Rubrimonas cliftonensis]SEA09655.1 nucleoside ABC transporter ATP-binding protein [Rubrimonas cliftonensis]
MTLESASAPPGRTGEPLLDVRGVSKRFGAVTAVDDVTFSIRAGERHALLGENGAGKSTVVKMIYGSLQPTAGGFAWRGEPVSIASPAAARAMGVGMVHQHFSVFEALTVAENVALALPREPMAALARRIREVSASYGLAIDPERSMHALSVGEKQRVEIIRCLLQQPKLLIMDEPTSVLTPQEAEALFVVLRRLSDEGCAVLYISHRLEEVRALCSAATILRRGSVVARCDPREMTARALAEAMIGAGVGAVERTPAPAPGPVRLALRGLTLPASDPFGMALRDVSLEARGGEVLAVAGVAGEGQSELFAALSGEARSAASMVEIDGRPAGALGPTARRLLGAAFAPEERNGHAAVGEMRLSENLALSHHAVAGLARGGALGRLLGGWIDWRAARAWSARVREAFDVRGGGEDPQARSLSGGNLQKFVIGREILREPGVLVVNQPTWGVDAGAAAAIRTALVRLARAGAAVVVVSQDLDEIFEIADRIAVMRRGALAPAAPTAEMTAERLGVLMGGADAAEAAA